MIEEKSLKTDGEKGIPHCLPGQHIPNRGNWRVFKPVINYEKCIKCHNCWLHCPDASYTISKEGYTHPDFNTCKGCGVCAKVCPVQCIAMERDVHRGTRDIKIKKKRGRKKREETQKKV